MARPPLTKHWRDEEVADLKRLLFDGLTSLLIALRLKRTPASIDRKLKQLSLPTPAGLKKQLQGGLRLVK